MIISPDRITKDLTESQVLLIAQALQLAAITSDLGGGNRKKTAQLVQLADLLGSIDCTAFHVQLSWRLLDAPEKPRPRGKIVGE